MRRTWCVQSRDGWCATRDGSKPEEGSVSVPTLCGYFVMFPYGYNKQRPDCPECVVAQGGEVAEG